MTWALRSLCRPSAKSALTHHPQAGGGMAFGHRAPSGVWLRHQLSPASIYSRRQRRLVHRTQPRRSPGAWGPSATNKRHRVYTCALLATTSRAYKKGVEYHSHQCYTLCVSIRQICDWKGISIMDNKSLKGIALILFGILLCLGGAEINSTLLHSLSDFPFSLLGVIVGAVGLSMIFIKNTDKKDE